MQTKEEFFSELRETIHQTVGVRKQVYIINDQKFLNARPHNEYISDLRLAFKNLKTEDVIKFSNGLAISKEIETAWEDREYVWKYGEAPKYRKVLRFVINGKHSRVIAISGWIKRKVSVA